MAQRSWLQSTPTPSAIAAYCCLGIVPSHVHGYQARWVGINALLIACVTASSLKLVNGQVRLPLSVDYGNLIQQLRDSVSATVASRNSPSLDWRNAVRIAKERFFLGAMQGEIHTSLVTSAQSSWQVKPGSEASNV